MESHSATRRNRIAVLAVIVLGVVVVAFLLNESAYIQGPSTAMLTATEQSPTVATTTQYALIKFEATQGESSWARSPITDLPEYSTLVTYVIRNEGNAAADDTHVIVEIDNVISKEYRVSIPAMGTHDGTVEATFVYDTTHQITFEAQSGATMDSVSVTIDAKLPRTLLEPNAAPSDETLALSKLFITPNDAEVKKTLSLIWQDRHTTERCIRGPSIYCPDWQVLEVIQDWVSYNIADRGTSNYAQLPRETLQSRAGSPQDRVILIVTLMRSAGAPQDRIFVVLATDGTTVNGWIRENLQRPQSLVTPLTNEPWYRHGFYAAVYYFNDAEANRKV